MTGVITLTFHDEPPPRLAIAGDARMTGAGAPQAQNAGDTANDDHYAAARFRPSRRSHYLLQGPQDRQASLLDEILKGAKVSERPFERPTLFKLVVNLVADSPLPADKAFKWRRVSDRVQRSNRYHQESNIVRPA